MENKTSLKPPTRFLSHPSKVGNPASQREKSTSILRFSMDIFPFRNWAGNKKYGMLVYFWRTLGDTDLIPIIHISYEWFKINLVIPPNSGLWRSLTCWEFSAANGGLLGGSYPWFCQWEVCRVNPLGWLSGELTYLRSVGSSPPRKYIWGFPKIGHQFSSILFWMFHEINHPATKG